MKYFVGLWATLELMFVLASTIDGVILSGLLVALIWTVALCWGGR